VLFPSTKGAFKWSVSDPESNWWSEFGWIMCGHLIMDDARVVVVDPPNAPGMTAAIETLGAPKAVILTTLEHLRGSLYLSKALKVPLYLPSQEAGRFMDPAKKIAEKGITKYVSYDGNVDLPIGLRAHRVTVDTDSNHPYTDEMALLTTNAELIVGDVASGSSSGEILAGPETFTLTPDVQVAQAHFRAIRKIILDTKASTLLASHNQDIVGNLQQMVQRRESRV